MASSPPTAVRQEPTSAGGPSRPDQPAPLAADLLLEDVSIDGMCGVY